MANRVTRRRFMTRAAAVGGVLASGVSAPTTVRAADDKWGDLVGKFSYDGKPPERKKLTVDKDVECCGKFDIRDESLMVGEKGGIQNVYVYVRSKKVEVCPDLEETVEEKVKLDNRDCIFQPHCMTIWWKKQKFWVVNSDPVAQNVAFTPLLDTPVNVVIPVEGEATLEFHRGQRIPVPIACNYHPWESAYILPLDHPYCGISAADGTFTIPKLPVGDLEFQVWHERMGYVSTDDWEKGRFELTVKPGSNDLGHVKLVAKMFEKD